MVLRERREGASKIPRIKNKSENTVYKNPDADEAILRVYCIAMRTHIKTIKDVDWEARLVVNRTYLFFRDSGSVYNNQIKGLNTL